MARATKRSKVEVCNKCSGAARIMVRGVMRRFPAKTMIDKGDLMLVLTNDHPAHGGACACCGSFKPVTDMSTYLSA